MAGCAAAALCPLPADEGGLAEPVAGWPAEGAAEPGAPCSAKYVTQAWSTELGSAVYCSYISSSSQSLAPKSVSSVVLEVAVELDESGMGTASPSSVRSSC